MIRASPSSRIFCEKRGASPRARTLGDIGDPPSRSVARFREDPPQAGLGERRRRRGGAADILDDGRASGADRLERADHRHQRGFFFEIRLLGSTASL